MSLVIDYDFKTNPSNQTIIAGNVLSLECVPPRSYPSSIQITWYRNYVQIQPKHGIAVSAAGTLEIVNANTDNEGMYFCQAVNSITRESRTSRKAYVTVRGEL